MTKFIYHRVKCVRVIDGDTAVFDFDLGFNLHLTGQRIRFFGIDAPPKNTDKGRMALHYVQQMIEGKDVVIRTIRDKRGKYGRLLGLVFLPGEKISVNRQLVVAGLAEKIPVGRKVINF